MEQPTTNPANPPPEEEIKAQPIDQTLGQNAEIDAQSEAEILKK